MNFIDVYLCQAGAIPLVLGSLYFVPQTFPSGSCPFCLNGVLWYFLLVAKRLSFSLSERLVTLPSFWKDHVSGCRVLSWGSFIPKHCGCFGAFSAPMMAQRTEASSFQPIFTLRPPLIFLCLLLGFYLYLVFCSYLWSMSVWTLITI